MKIHIIAAALPPQMDGIGDYTACLAAELAHSADVTILTGASQPTPIPGVRIETAFAADAPVSVKKIAAFVKADKPDWVLLQYNPFSYGRWGLNLHLPEMMRGLRRVSPGTRLAIMVHEPFVPIITPQFAVMAAWQRWQLWRLGQCADVLFFSIEPWVKQFKRWFPGKPVYHLPVGSNIEQAKITRTEARARLGIVPNTVVLGVFGTAGSGRLLGWVKDALDALHLDGIPAQLLYIGPDSQGICAALGSENIIAGGPFPAEEVSRRLSAMDIYLAAYIDGVSTRRGAFMAALQHGIAAVATSGPLTDTMLKQEAGQAFLLTDTMLKQEAGQAFLLADVADPKVFTAAVVTLAQDTEQRKQLGQAAQVLYQREFAWESAAAHLLSSLDKETK